MPLWWRELALTTLEPTDSYVCAFCGNAITETGADPSKVELRSRHRPGRTTLTVHIGCFIDALHPSIREERFPTGYYALSERYPWSQQLSATDQSHASN